MARPCKYGCGTQLEGFDEENRKYLEAGTGGLHTKERCQEAKTKIQQKNDHGNELIESPKELYQRIVETNQTGHISTGYVDHTLKGQSKVKIFVSENVDELQQLYNQFLKSKNGEIKTQGAQFQMNSSEMAIALYYEEVAKQ